MSSHPTQGGGKSKSSPRTAYGSRLIDKHFGDTSIEGANDTVPDLGILDEAATSQLIDILMQQEQEKAEAKGKKNTHKGPLH
ncbi:MAG: hypothetical protein K0S38_1096 [Candidatus Paceibacter sp.]|jgi:hypothetical protein|nr:hypothetical protein [Candidatus Paceibacter sp.]